MTTWLSPSSSVGRAAGSATLSRSWRPVQPDMVPASMISAGTPRMPRMVQRAMDGMANRAVASSAGTWPKPNSTITGAR